MGFDINVLIRKLRRKHPVAWAIVATLGNVVRSAVRVIFPIFICMTFADFLLGEIFSLAGLEVSRLVVLLLIAVVLAVSIYSDQRAEYDVQCRRGGVERPSVGHDLLIMFSNLQYWLTLVVSMLMVCAYSTYFAPEIARLLPGESPGMQALYALLIPALVIAFLVTLSFFGCMRIWYALTPADEEPQEPEFYALWRILANAFAWLIAILVLPFGMTIIVSVVYALVSLVILYWKWALILFAAAFLVFGGGAVLRAWRIRSQCVRQLRKTMDEANVRYRFEAHPVRSAFFGGEPISLLVFIGDDVLAVRMVSYLKRRGTLILTPDGNLGTLHTIATRIGMRPMAMIVATEMTNAAVEPISQTMTQWITKKETAFDAPSDYPNAERIYLISPTPKFWVTGDLKRTAPLDNASEAYGYRVWTTSAFCRHIRLRAEDNAH